MELTSRVEYALLALIELTDHYAQNRALKMNEIASKHSHIPERYLEQILLTLRREGIIQSQRGAKGGYVLAREPWQISLLEVIKVVNGKSSSANLDATERSSIEQSAVYYLWSQACQASESVFEQFTLQDLCQSRERYRRNDPMYYI